MHAEEMAQCILVSLHHCTQEVERLGMAVVSNSSELKVGLVTQSYDLID